EAALRQTGHVRMYQTGPHAAVCTRLLNEIAQARAVLLNPKSRREYDGRLAPARREPAMDTPSRNGGRLLDRVLAAAGYALLLVVGFAASFCLTYQSLHPAAPPQNDLPDEAVPSGEPAP